MISTNFRSDGPPPAGACDDVLEVPVGGKNQSHPQNQEMQRWIGNRILNGYCVFKNGVNADFVFGFIFSGLSSFFAYGA